MVRTEAERAAVQRLQINYLCDEIMHRIDSLALSAWSTEVKGSTTSEHCRRVQGLRANFKRLRHAITQVLGQSQAVLDLSQPSDGDDGRAA